MNGIQGLTLHDRSANHLKSKDRHYSETSVSHSSQCDTNEYPSDSIHHLILRSKINIVGISLLEGYMGRRSQIMYYKCILSGAHGKKEAINQHVLGDKHTDKYISVSIDNTKGILTREDRNLFREKLARRDGLCVEKIKIFKDPKSYPHKWEDEGISKSALISKYRNHPDTLQILNMSKKGRNLKKESSAVALRKKIEEEQMASTEKPKMLETPRGVKIHRDMGVSCADGVQVFNEWAIERCLKKLNFLNHTRGLPQTEVKRQEDVKMCIQLMHSLYVTALRFEEDCR